VHQDPKGTSYAGPDIPHRSLSSLHAPIKQELLEAVSRVLDGDDFAGDGEVDAFERRFAEMLGTKHAVSFSSGTNALGLTLRAMGLQYGEEVITVPNAPVVTVSSIALAGGSPAFVDVGDDYNIDPSRVEEALTPRTRAIIATHLTGRPAAMDELNALGVKFGLVVVEDAGQAFLARYRGRPVGALGSVGCFSLDQSNPLGACGDGGVAVTDDAQFADRLLALRNSAHLAGETVYWVPDTSLAAIQAAILLVKLEQVRAWTERRRRNATFYQEALNGLEGLTVPKDCEWEHSAYHSFVVRTKRRDDLKAHLAERGIGSDIPFGKPLHLQPVAFPLGYRVGDFPNAEAQSGEALCLPVQASLTEEHLHIVAEGVRNFFV